MYILSEVSFKKDLPYFHVHVLKKSSYILDNSFILNIFSARIFFSVGSFSFYILDSILSRAEIF